MGSFASRHGAMIFRGALLGLIASSSFACVAASSEEDSELAESNAGLEKGQEDILRQNEPSIEQPSIAKPTDIALGLEGQTMAPSTPSVIYIPCGEDSSSLIAKGGTADGSAIVVCAEACTPGTTRPCYDGPAGTVDVGVCHAGTQICYPDGGGWTTCKGQVLPSAEVCGSAEDEDCNGSGSCPNVGGVEWVASYTTQFQSGVVPWSLASDSAGNFIAGGTFDYNGTFAGVNLSNDSLTNGFVQKLSPTGAPVWTKNYAGSSTVRVNSVSTDSQNNVIVAGYFYGSMTSEFGTSQSTSGADVDSFIAKYHSDGTPLWIRTIGGAASDELTQATVDANGSIIFGVRASSALTFGGYTHAPAPGRGMIGKLDSAGNPVWGRPGPWNVNDMDSRGTDVALAGSFGGTFDFGTGPIVGLFEDAYVVKIDGSGATQWVRTAGASGQDLANAVGMDAAGNVFVGGTFSAGTMSWGGSAAPLTPAGSWHDAFIVKLDANGVGQWSRAFGDGSYLQSVKTIDVDGAGNVTIGADCSGLCDPGLGLAGSGSGGASVVVVTYAGNGTPVFQKALNANVNVNANWGVAVANGKIGAAGIVPYNSYDFGTGLLPRGAYVMQIQP